MVIKVEKVEKEIPFTHLLSLEAELNGIQFSGKDGKEVVIKGLVNQDLLQSIKVHLFSLSDKITKEKENYNRARKEIAESLGKPIKDKKTKQVVSYDLKGKEDEFKSRELDLANQTVKIQVPVFEANDLLSFKSEESYYFSTKYLTNAFDE